MKVSEIVKIVQKYSSQITEYDHCNFEKYIDSDLLYVDSWTDWSPRENTDQHAKRIARWIQLFRKAIIGDKLCEGTLFNVSPVRKLLHDTVIELDWVDSNVEVCDGNHRLCALLYILKADGDDTNVIVDELYLKRD